MAAHSDIGPSAADRWVNCPGSIQLSRDPRAVSTRVSEYASQGTVAHTLVEELTVGTVDEMALMGRIGEVVEQDGNEITIDEEMVLHVLEEVREVAEEIAAIEHRPAPLQVKTEVRVHLSSVDPELWGTADKIIFRKGHVLIVRDFKYGKGKRVKPEKNPQLSIYTLAAMESIAGEAFDRVEQVIAQPRAGGTSRWTVDMDWLRSFKQQAKNAIELSRQPNAPLKAGDWCAFCKAKSFCPAIEKAAAAETQVDFENAPQPGALMRAESMPPWKIGRILDHQDLIEGWLSSVRALAQQMLESGQSVPGYKLVDGRSSRKWVDGTGESAANRYATEHGDKVYAPRKVKSVAQMEVLVGKKNLETALYETTPGHKKVANDSDPRPEAVSTAQAEFVDVAAPSGVAVIDFNDPFLAPPVVMETTTTPVYDPFLDPVPATVRVVEAGIVERPVRKIWPD